MKQVTAVKQIAEFETGAALYSVIADADGTFLLGLGLWDRANVNHTKEEKNRTKGQVVRIDRDGKVLARSPELSNIVYQLMPVDQTRIFVGCRNGDLVYLNPDLTFQRAINFHSTGLYFWAREDENTLVAGMREGAVVFLDLNTDQTEVLPIVDPSVRIWPILKDEDRYIAGSYRGHLAIIEDRRVVNMLDPVGDKRSSIWTVDFLNGHDLVGTARGELWGFDRNLKNRVLVYQNASAITAVTVLNSNQVAIGDLKGDLRIVDLLGNVLHYPNPGQEQVHHNTIWWITSDPAHGLMRIAYANGQLRTLRAT